MKKSLMSVKAMIDLYLTYGLDEKTWDMLHEMACHDLISNDNWLEFYDICKDWTFSEDGSSIVDFQGKPLFYFNEDGYLVKA